MSFVVENKTLWRVIFLALFILSMLGPWMYESLYVPEEYPCGEPTIRLHGDFCGYPMSGFQVIAWFAGGFAVMVVQLVTGAFSGRARELLSGIFLFPLVPFLSALLLLLRKESRRLQKIDLILRGLAFTSVLSVIVLQIEDQVFHLWGLWLYVTVAFGAFVIEFFIFGSDTRAGRDIS